MSNKVYIQKKDGDWGTSLGNMGLSGSKFHKKIIAWLSENDVFLKEILDFKMINGYWKLELIFKTNEDLNLFLLVFGPDCIVDGLEYDKE